MKIVEILNKDMPEKLRIIKNSPTKLYAIGNLELLNKKSFAIVGTRKITEYGIKNCKIFAEELSLRNIPIVSGMAIGTDTVAHKTALENMNETITALSEGILVIEAGYRSGTSITAKHAKEQGKKVFAIPGRTDCNVGIGVNELIKKGAILTTNIEDILKYYPEFAQKVKRVKKNYNKKYEKIINILEEGEKSMQELINLSNMKVYELFELITNMEIENIIFKNYFGKYALVKL